MSRAPLGNRDLRRLVLFDVDGTLVAGGPAKEAFRVALEAAFGETGPIEVHDFSGKTDPQIARELLTEAGLSDRDVDEGFPDLWSRYLAELEARLPSRPMEALDGVQQLLGELEAVEDALLGLVTGNILDGARLKLSSASLDEPFGDFRVGGFGSDSEARNDLPPIAIERARGRLGHDVTELDVIVVGDTPRDIECGRNAGCRTVGVATGRFDLATLEQAGADVVFESFLDTAVVLDALLR